MHGGLRSPSSWVVPQSLTYIPNPSSVDPAYGTAFMSPSYCRKQSLLPLWSLFTVLHVLVSITCYPCLSSITLHPPHKLVLLGLHPDALLPQPPRLKVLSPAWCCVQLSFSSSMAHMPWQSSSPAPAGTELGVQRGCPKLLRHRVSPRHALPGLILLVSGSVEHCFVVMNDKRKGTEPPGCFPGTGAKAGFGGKAGLPQAAERGVAVPRLGNWEEGGVFREELGYPSRWSRGQRPSSWGSTALWGLGRAESAVSQGGLERWMLLQTHPETLLSVPSGQALTTS